MKKNQNLLYQLAADNSPNIWQQIKKLNNPPLRPVLEIVNPDGSTSRNKDAILNRWFEDISQLFSGLRENPDLAFDDSFLEEVLKKKDEFEAMTEEEQHNTNPLCLNTDVLNRDLEFKEVSDAIDNLKTGKAYLEIPNEAMKNLNSKILLHRFLSTCFASGMSPTEWQNSHIKPIPKPEKDPRDPLQNRCIAILCCVAKLFSSILNTRLQNYLEGNGLLVDEQNGFRRNRSCIDHLFTLVTVLRNRKDMKKDTYLAFIDFRKAFDTVQRGLLFYKLTKMGINGRMYQSICSLYSNPRSRVILEGLETDYFDCPMGVKQGDCLSPTLFSIYINDLAENLKEADIGIDMSSASGNFFDEKLSILMSADDIVCLAENALDLQDILFIVENWCRKWRLEVNLTKTNVMHVRNSRKQQSNFTFLFDHKIVPYCSNYKYLGATINEFLDLGFTVNKHAESAGRALGGIITKMIKNGGFPFKVYSMLYNACVVSVMDYSAAVFGPKEYQSAMNVHLRAIRAFLGVPKNTCIPGILSEVDLLLPHHRAKLQMVRHYHRLLSMNNDRMSDVFR